MPATHPASSLTGLPLTSLKAKAAVHQDPNLTLPQWIGLVNHVYQAAVEADDQKSTELAYVEYFKAAGILQLILKHPGFKALKSQPANYRIYLEVAPKVLASTTRAKELAEIIERQNPYNSSSNSRNRPLGGGITSRIKSLEAAGLAAVPGSPQSPTIQPITEESNQSIGPSSSTSRRPLPLLPVHKPNGVTTRSNFISTALESESTIRSGSAPPELVNAADAQSSRDPATPGLFNTFPDRLTGDKAIDDQLLEQTLRSLRSPAEFNEAFPALENLSLDDRPSNGLHFLSELPQVPKGLPVKHNADLPPPPKPFLLPNYETETTSSPSSDTLVNDTSLGAGLIINTALDSQPITSPPPPYPDFETEQSDRPHTPTFLTRSRAFRNSKPQSPSSHLPQPNGISHSSPKKSTRPYQTLEPPPSLPTGTHEILPAVLIDYFRKMSTAGLETSVLFLDVRNRPDFEACRIKSQDVVCIEPLVLTKHNGIGLSSQDIEESLVISPKKEQRLFERRQEFEYVILYDRRSIQLPISDPHLMHSNDPTDVPAKLMLILYSAIHKHAYVKTLKNPPMLLIGGLEGWTKVAGESGVVGKGTAVSPKPSQTTFTHSSMNGTPIVFRQPVNEADQTHLTNGNGISEGTSDIKRARRQVALLQRDSSNLPHDFVRSVADLTRSNAGGSNVTQSPSSSNGSGPSPHYNPRPPNNPSYLSNGYQSPIGVNCSITLPEQTLQRKSSQPLYDAPITSHPVDSSTPYPSNSSMHHPSSEYVPPTGPHQPPLYSSHPHLYLAPRHADSIYNGYIPSTLRPVIQYPHFNAHRTNPDPHMILGRPPQPPPPAATPGGGVPNYYNLLPYASNSSLAPPYARETPPVTPYSPGTHGPTEVYFNSSFEDGQVGLTGLKNLGNTCYMNSTLQCISATIPLARFFKDGSYKRCVNRVNPLGTKGELAESVAELVRVLWGAQYTFVSPTTFREAICRFAPQFRGSEQHDAQEFLGFLLDGLHEDLNLVTQKPPPVEMSPAREAELEALPTQLASAREWEIYKRRDNSVIVELFQGQYRSRLQCLTCGTTSTTYNTFMYLSLPIPTGRGMSKVSLTQCLDAFLKEEIMEKDDAWNCPKCKTRRKATKRLSLARLPPILLIHLKRFSFKGPFSDKLEAFVQYPLYGLDLTSYIPAPLDPQTQQPKQQKWPSKTSKVGPSMVYDLYAVCNHFGSLSSGHYTAFVRSQKDWYNIGDSRVSKTDENAVKARSAYLLCFRRRD